MFFEKASRNLNGVELGSSVVAWSVSGGFSVVDLLVLVSGLLVLVSGLVLVSPAL